MNASFYTRFVLLVLILTMASACSVDIKRPCITSLERLMLPPDLFGDATAMSIPDRGVAIDNVAQTNSVCHGFYEFSEGGGAFLDIYLFDGIDATKTGFQYIIERVARFNPEYEIPLQPPTISGSAPRADDLSVSCVSQDQHESCSIVARYGLRIYVLNVIQPSHSSLIEERLLRVIKALDGTMTSSNK